MQTVTCLEEQVTRYQHQQSAFVEGHATNSRRQMLAVRRCFVFLCVIISSFFTLLFRHLAHHSYLLQFTEALNTKKQALKETHAQLEDCRRQRNALVRRLRTHGINVEMYQFQSIISVPISEQ